MASKELWGKLLQGAYQEVSVEGKDLMKSKEMG